MFFINQSEFKVTVRHRYSEGLVWVEMGAGGSDHVMKYNPCPIGWVYSREGRHVDAIRVQAEGKGRVRSLKLCVCDFLMAANCGLPDKFTFYKWTYFSIFVNR